MTPTADISTLATAPHPLLPLPSPEEMEAMLATAEGSAELKAFLEDRARLLQLMEADPFTHGAEFPHWQEADRLLRQYALLYISGGKRASKSEYAAKRFVKCCRTYPRSIRWCFQDNERTSIATQQALIWKYLPPEIKAYNQKKDPRGVYKINYSVAGGFADRVLVFPNGTQVHFLTYNQDPADFQGWELGKPTDVELDPEVPDIGAWPDENLTPQWFETLKFRCSNRGAKILWTYSPLEGITSTIKAFRGTPKTIQSRPSELLPDRVNVPGAPLGQMPYIQTPSTPNAAIIYFFTQWNPFSGYGNPGGVKELCMGKDTAYVMRNAYGYCEDTAGRAFPLFGEWNIVDETELPAAGTNYMATDPAGARNWATVWARVTPGKEPAIYIYREWPDEGRFGEWAKTSDDPGKFDGAPGPAQNAIGYGPAEYKALFLREERIAVSAAVRELAEDLQLAPDDAVLVERLEAALQSAYADPYRRRVVMQAIESGAELDQLTEAIYERFIDPRAGRNQAAAEKGGTCLIDKLLETQRHPRSGEIIGPSLLFHPAPGLDIDDGVSQINTLLYFNKEQEMIPLLNYPRLFVSKRCKNLIWALEHWTGKDGEKGACKDWVDLIRYLVTAGIRHVEGGGKVKTTGGGSY